VSKEARGLRFRFAADAEIAPENARHHRTPARVTEISLRGCFIETSAVFEQQRRLFLKIFNDGQYFEAEAALLYNRTGGMGLLFCEVKAPCRTVLQKWILAALHLETEPGDPVTVD
jgi:hypothetical protein